MPPSHGFGGPEPPAPAVPAAPLAAPVPPAAAAPPAPPGAPPPLVPPFALPSPALASGVWSAASAASEPPQAEASAAAIESGSAAIAHGQRPTKTEGDLRTNDHTATASRFQIFRGVRRTFFGYGPRTIGKMGERAHPQVSRQVSR